MHRRNALACVVLAAALPLVPIGQRSVLAAQSSARSCALLKPKNGGAAPEVDHRSLDHVATCSVRLARGDQLWVETVDANELIYEYKLADVAVPAPTPPPASQPSCPHRSLVRSHTTSACPSRLSRTRSWSATIL